MKQKLKRKKRLLILGIMLSLIFYQCQQDDLQTLEEPNNLQTDAQEQNTSQLVSGKDIPSIVDFVKQQTDDRLQVKLSNLSDNSRQADLPIGNLSTDVVKQVTNQYGRSNYTFAMVKDVDADELSYINYVVKDTRYGMYSYFVEYIPEILIQHQSDPQPEANGYSGEIRIYNQYGVYIGSNTFENGNKTSDHYRHSCDNDTDGGSGGGGGNTGDGTGPSGPSSGDGSGSGGGGVDITLVCGEVYLQQIDCPPNCECTACFIEVQDCDIIVRTSDDYYNKTGKRDPLRRPCPPIDNSDQNCRCPDDVPDGQNDVDPSDENPSGGVLLDLLEIVALNQFLEPNLTLEQIELITELDISDELLDYLENNVDPDEAISFEEALAAILDPIIVRLNQQISNPIIASYIENYQNAVENSPTELGAEFRLINGQLVDFPVPSNYVFFSGTRFPPVQINTVVRVHMHHNTTNVNGQKIQPIFSIEDVFGMASFFVEKENLGAIDNPDISSILVSRVGLYALVVTDPDKVLDFFDSLNDFVQDDNGRSIRRWMQINNDYEKTVLRKVIKLCGNCTDEQEAALFEALFIRFLNRLDTGLSLYQAFLLSNGEYDDWILLN